MDVLPQACSALRVLASGADTVLTRNPRMAVDWCRAALQLVPSVRDSGPRHAELLLSMARAYARIGELAECRAALVRWDAVADANQKLNEAADLLAILALAEGRFTHARVILRGAISHPSTLDDVTLRLELAATALWDTHWSWSDAALVAAKEGRHLHRAHALVMLATEVLDREEVDEALLLVKESARLVDPRSDEELAERPGLMSDLGWTEMHLGQHRTAHERLRRGLLVCESSGQYLPVATLQAGIAELAMRQGDLSVATDRAERAVSISRSIGHHDQWAMALVVRADVALAAGRHRQALADAKRAMEVVDLDSPQWRRAQVAYGAAALARGDADACVSAILDAGGDQLRELPVWQRARAAKLLAKAERASGQARSSERWEKLAARYDALLRSPERDDAEPCLLSRREFEIAGLVSEGRTNRQIARLLGVSHKTVETHLARIFAKAGVSSRAELAGLTVSRRVVARPRG